MTSHMKIPCRSCGGTGRATPRTFLARWVDEDRGPRSVTIVASDEHAARELVEQVTDHVDLIVSPA